MPNDEEPTKWTRGRWWRVLAKDGSLWCETSDQEEARREHRKKKDSVLQNLWVKEEAEWRDEE